MLVAGVASPTGASARILRNVFVGTLSVVVSAGIEAEYRDVISRRKIAALFTRHQVERGAYRRTIDAICILAQQAAPTGEPPACRDERDRKYLHCAAFASLNYVLTYDRDMLDLTHVEAIPIVTPADFLQLAGSSGLMLVE